MKRLSYLLAVAVISFVSTTDSHAARHAHGVTKVCKKVLSATDKGLFIYKNSAPIRKNSRMGSPIVGFRQEPTLIMNKNISSKGTASIYDAKGTKIGSCPWAPAHGHGGGRYRCTMNTSALRRTAVKNARTPNGFFKINKNTCVEVPDLGRCFGSVKGMCNRTLR